MVRIKALVLAAAALLATPAVATSYLTGSAGSGTSFGNYQPSLAVTQFVPVAGIYPSRDGGSTAPTMGMIHSFAGNFAPFGSPAAQGQLMPIAQNTALFSILGTQFGGNGQTNFALPNLAGTSMIGAGQGTGLPNYVIGQSVGSALASLSLGELANHDHGLPGGGLTSAEGGGLSFDNMQPSLAVNYLISPFGIYPHGGPTGGVGTIGEIAAFAGNFEPGGWMFADGRLLAISEYETLFNVIGTTYGGDGQTTFALPDLRGRTIIGAGNGIALGQAGGSPETTLTEAQMPTHDHSIPGDTTDAAGGGQPVDNRQPSLALNYFIALQGIYPSRDGGGGIFDGESFLGEIRAFAGMAGDARGWALAAGQLLAINQNQALFSLLGTQFGGDGRTTFALPDLRGRSIIGSGAGFDVGQQTGTNFNTLSVANLPAHTHVVTVDGAVPEPATWAMLIAGFALVGGAMRRRPGGIVRHA